MMKQISLSRGNLASCDFLKILNFGGKKCLVNNNAIY